MPTDTTSKVLFVDDDPHLLASMQRTLRTRFVLEVTQDPDEAITMITTNGPYAVVVADMSMPVMNGIEFLETVRVIAPETVRIMLTGNAEQQTAASAVNRGSIFRFLSKPCATELVSAALESALKHYHVTAAEKEVLSQTLNASLQMLTDVLAMLDPDAFGHAQARHAAVRVVAENLGTQSTWDVEIASLLGDIGLVTLPPAVREKVRARESLTSDERQLVDRIPEFSARMLATIPRLSGVAEIVHYQNKHFDGTGFPVNRVRGVEIPVGARLIHVVDAAVRMIRSGTPVENAVSALLAGPERYDPAMARALATCAADLPLSASANKRGMRSLRMSHLEVGHFLLSDILTEDGSVVMKSGSILNPALLQRLKNFSALHRLVEPILVDIPFGVNHAA